MPNLNVRIYSKYDTYANWMASTLVLGPGEIAVASIPSGDATGLTPPAIGIKVGDGTKTFAQLSWIQSTAGDVHEWAKASTKPEYSASEITGLKDFVESIPGIDTNTEYSFSVIDDYKVKIQKKDVGGEYADYQTVDFTEAFNAVKTIGENAQRTANDLKTYVGTFTPVGSETTVVDYVDAKINAIPSQVDYSVTVTESSSESYAKIYTFSQKGSTVATINIPKDMVVESGTVVTNPEGQPAGTYLKLVLANAASDVIYINVGDLIEYVTGGTASDGVITVAVDPVTHVATATINDGTITLDKLSDALKEQLAKAHTHTNKALLDTYTQTEEDLADAVTKKHSHANAAELNKIVEGDKAKWDAAAAANHTHDNKSVLDGITSSKVSAWDAAQANVLEGIAGVTGTTSDKIFTVTGVSTDLLAQGNNAIIFNCGSSNA